MDVRLPMVPARPPYPWFARAVLGFDTWLRRRNGVYEYSAHPHCAFRMQIVCIRHDILLADGTHLHPGERVIDLHIWNEQFPCFATGAATLSAGSRRHSRHPRRHQARRRVDYRAAAAHLSAVRLRARSRSRTAVHARAVAPIGRKHLHRVAGSGTKCGRVPAGGTLARPDTDVPVASRSRAPLWFAKTGRNREFDLRRSHFSASIAAAFPLDCARLQRFIHPGKAGPARNCGNAEYSLKWHLRSAR